MDQNKPELTFDESVSQVMQTLPPVIRAYLVQGKHTGVAKSLMAKYGLRIDQAGVLEQEIILLLMGVDTPAEFTQALTEEAKLNKQTIDSIVRDVNNQVFIPLRKEEMQSGGMNAPESAQPPRSVNAQVPNYATPATPASVPQQPMSAPTPPPAPPKPEFPKKSSYVEQLPKGIYAPPPQSPRYPNQDQDNMSAYIHQVPRTPSNVPPRQPQPVNKTINRIPPAPQKPMDNNRLLEDHEEPSPSLKATEGAAHVEFNKTQGASAETPLRQALRTVVPADLPGAMPGATPNVQPPAQGKPPTPPPPVSYSVDPYHEPIE